MDAFYAAIEQRDQPELRGRPVIVGGTPEGRGVVSTASYEARVFGVHSAMPAGTARRLCPQGVFLRPRMDVYAAVGAQVRDILQRFTPLVEPLSLDEAFLDVTGSERLFGSGEEIGRRIKREIASELGLVASVGVAPNKFLAKIASDLEKPDGFTMVPPDRVAEFLEPLPIRRLWGVGKVAEAKLKSVGIETVGRLARLGERVLIDLFGANGGAHLYELAQGRDERDVIPDHRAVSISHETTFAVELHERRVLLAVLQQLTDQVARRLRRMGVRARTVQLKIRYSDFQTYTRSQTLPEATNSTRAFWRGVRELFATKLPARPLDVRLIGVGLSQFDRGNAAQGKLFSTVEDEREQSLDAARDRIANRFGSGALRPGTFLEGPSDPPADQSP